MKKRSWFMPVIALLPLTLSGCQWFNSVGEHFPVIGERCENWQCFTQAGRQQSELNKQARQNQASGSASKTPANSDTVPATTAPATDSTPYTMTPAQLQALPPATAP